MININDKLNKNKMDLQLVSDHWGLKSNESLEYRNQISWMDYPLIQGEYLNSRYSDNLSCNWLDYIKKKYVSREFKNGLSLGCGSGGLERHAIGINICEYFDAFDCSEDAILAAKKLAINQGILERVDYYVCDINKICLEKEKYDIAFACMSAHHFSELEWIFDQVKSSLKPGGYFILNEFVGPNQFQWTDKQLNIANKLLKILPTRYKESISNPGVYKNEIIKSTIEEMNLLDPSEAIRSSDIYSCIKEHFLIIWEDFYGGTILHLLLNDIVGNFNIDLEADRALIRILCEYEKQLIDNNVLPSDFMLLVSKK